MKTNIIITIALVSLLAGCAYGLKHIDSSKTGSSDWEKIENAKQKQ